MNRRIKTLYTSLMILTLLDIATTLILLDLGGIETNPITLWQWETLGLEKTAIIKILLVVFLGLLIWLVSLAAKTEEDKRVANIVLTGVLVVCNLFYIAVVINNFYWMIYAATSG